MNKVEFLYKSKPTSELELPDNWPEGEKLPSLEEVTEAEKRIIEGMRELRIQFNKSLLPYENFTITI